MSGVIALAGGFSVGIALQSVFFSVWFVFFFAVLAILFGAAAFLKPRAFYILSFIFCLFFTFGLLRAAVADTPLPKTFADQLGQRVFYEGTVVADPDVRDTNERVELAVWRAGVSTTVLAILPRHQSVSVGDKVFVSGTLEKPEPFMEDGGRTFRYDKYLERDGVRFLLNFASVRVERSPAWYSIPALLAEVKHAFLRGIAVTLPEPYASLAGGIVIGGKSGLGPALQTAFIRSGLVQVIVLSGYNVMVVAEWIMAFFVFARFPRRLVMMLTMLALITFVGIAGLSATALRAALMALIALYARATSRTYVAGRALFFVVFVMLLVNPLYLLYDPGFDLSVLATAGLIWLAPIFEMMFSGMQNTFFKNALATTLAAQVAVLPLLLYLTGNLSLVALPANVFTLPIIPLAMGFSALAGFAGMLFGGFLPFAAMAFAFPAYLINTYILFVAEKSSSLPYGAVTLPLFSFWFVVLLYGVLIYLASSKRFSTMLQLTFARKTST